MSALPPKADIGGRQIDVRANFARMRFARPFKAFVGHRTKLAGRFHGTASKQRPIVQSAFTN